MDQQTPQQVPQQIPQQPQQPQQSPFGHPVPQQPQQSGFQPIPQPPMYQPPPGPQEDPGKAWGIVGLVVGILGVILSCSIAFFFFGLPLSAAALICGFVGKNKTPAGMKGGLAIASIVLGIVGLVISLAVTALFFLGLAGIGAELGTSDMGEIFHYLLTY